MPRCLFFLLEVILVITFYPFLQKFPPFSWNFHTHAGSPCVTFTEFCITWNRKIRTSSFDVHSVSFEAAPSIREHSSCVCATRHEARRLLRGVRFRARAEARTRARRRTGRAWCPGQGTRWRKDGRYKGSRLVARWLIPSAHRIRSQHGWTRLLSRVSQHSHSLILFQTISF